MKLKRLLLAACILIVIFLFLYIQNNLIAVTKIELPLKNLPQGFNGYRIVQISDLQNKVFGNGNDILVSKIKKSNPDLIIITGDLIDAAKYNEEIILGFIDDIKHIAPIYFITGNHEMYGNYMLKLEPKLNKKNIKILRNSSENIERNGETITLIGIDDPIETQESKNYITSEKLEQELDKILSIRDASNFKILLSHRPEFFSLYAKYNIDLTFAGHAHGGQIILPFIGGLYAPGQGFFPKYTSGRYELDASTMIVNRGLGNSSIPQRIFNRPEIVVVTIEN
jgi:predicted MPP superfamily phosphohydrolase